MLDLALVLTMTLEELRALDYMALVHPTSKLSQVEHDQAWSGMHERFRELNPRLKELELEAREMVKTSRKISQAWIEEYNALSDFETIIVWTMLTNGTFPSKDDIEYVRVVHASCAARVLKSLGASMLTPPVQTHP